MGWAPVPSQPETASKSIEMASLTRFESGLDGVGFLRIGSDACCFPEVAPCCSPRTSSCLQTIRPSMPPSTLRHWPDIWPDASWLAKKATALATSLGSAIFLKGTVPCDSKYSSFGSSSRSPISSVLTHPGATALMRAFPFNRTISFFTVGTSPYCKPDLPEAYSACPAWPNLPHSLPVTTMAKFSSSRPRLSWAVLAARRKCLMVRKVPLTLTR